MAISDKELAFNFNEDEMRLKISSLERELHKIFPFFKYNQIKKFKITITI